MRAAVGLQTEQAPRWLFVDADADLSALSAADAGVGPGITLPPLENDMAGLAFTGIAVGVVQEVAG